MTFTQAEVDRIKRYRDTAGRGDTRGTDPRDVAFHWELAGPDGASFVLIREAHHTDEDIAAAKHWIRQRRDVVGPIRIATVSEQPK